MHPSLITRLVALERSAAIAREAGKHRVVPPTRRRWHLHVKRKALPAAPAVETR